MRYLTEDDVGKYAETFYKIANALHYGSERYLMIPFNGKMTRIINHDWNRFNNTMSKYKEYITDSLEFSLELGEYFYVFCEFQKNYEKGVPYELPDKLASFDMKLNRYRCTLYDYTIDADEFENYMVVATLMASDLKAVRHGY